MGNVPPAFSGAFSTRDVKVLMAGLDAAGKSTVLYKLKSGNRLTTIPMAVRCGTVERRNMRLHLRDTSSRQWDYDAEGAGAVVFIVDSNDASNIERARDELHKLATDDALSNAALLVMANKQDLPRAMSPAELTDRLGLKSLRLREWFIQGTCAATGEGLYEGLDWLAASMKRRSL
eukprot:TRINITY_DN92_c1_g1_i3.p1 TRINITY_DN92_c1_g1~~TRINITY_DN92_c1_g1_i3.p1  ORF type:complete len:199 (+),score=66.04 TRINITY_DN92_c1_g1_i3:71-598(+)